MKRMQLNFRTYILIAFGIMVICAGVLFLQQRIRRNQERELLLKGGLILRVNHANLLAEQGHFIDSARAYEEIAEDYKKSEIAPEALLFAGGAWQAAGQRDKAIAEYEKILRNYPRTFFRPGIEFALQSVKSPSSQKLFSKNDPVSQKFLSITHLEKKGEYAEAARQYETLADVNPKHALVPLALLSAGNSCFLAGHLDKAEELWRKLLEKYPNSSYRADADFALRSMSDPNAQKALREALSDSPIKSPTE